MKKYKRNEMKTSIQLNRTGLKEMFVYTIKEYSIYTSTYEKLIVSTRPVVIFLFLSLNVNELWVCHLNSRTGERGYCVIYLFGKLHSLYVKTTMKLTLNNLMGMNEMEKKWRNIKKKDKKKHSPAIDVDDDDDNDDDYNGAHEKLYDTRKINLQAHRWTKSKSNQSEIVETNEEIKTIKKKFERIWPSFVLIYKWGLCTLENIFLNAISNGTRFVCI